MKAASALEGLIGNVGEQCWVDYVQLSFQLLQTLSLYLTFKYWNRSRNKYLTRNTEDLERVRLYH